MTDETRVCAGISPDLSVSREEFAWLRASSVIALPVLRPLQLDEC